MSAIKWNPDQARNEGWDIFEIDGEGALQLQRDDETAREQSEAGKEVTFNSDGDVAAFVINSACEGAEYHRDALAIVLGAAKWDR